MKIKKYVIILLFLITLNYLQSTTFPREFNQFIYNIEELPESFIKILPEKNLVQVLTIEDSVLVIKKQIKILNNIAENKRWQNTYGVYPVIDWLDVSLVVESSLRGQISIDMPDKLDLYLQQDLSNIFIKGVDDPLRIEKDSDNIFILNKDMVSLFSFFDYKMIPVVVQHQQDDVLIEEFYIHKDDFFSEFNQWKHNWENQDIANYLRYYHSDFFSKSNQMDLDAWINYKKGIFKNNQKVSVTFTNVSYILKDNYLYMEGLQEYNSDNYQDFGKKIMVWKLENNEWFIWAEDWYEVEKPIGSEKPVEIVEPIEITPKPVIDTVKTVWELNQGKFPYDYINFLFPKLHNYNENLIIVEKKDQSAALYKVNDNYKNIELIKTYKISSGQNKGNKMKRGDLKTPEGLYLTQRFIPGEDLSSKYGTGAFTLNYPNQLDKILKKTGYGIWLHGSDIDMIPFDTEGCIRFENDEIIHFVQLLNPQNTPVIIDEEIKWYSYDELENEVKVVLHTIDYWKEVWQNKDFENYITLYLDEFYSDRQKMDYTQWYNHKMKLFKSEEDININIYDFDFYYAEGLLLISFYQDYETGEYRDFGKKSLVLKQLDNQWKIIKEEWQVTSKPSNSISKGE
ncbi:MAG: L,D-transpeptidase family protein [Candidatus Cloacimonetes bacterium]|nr:L,D-transpeptidase family protein [Candidatus Cloacimonadota bacterium]